MPIFFQSAHSSALAAKRPLWSEQITSPEGIIPGRFLRHVDFNGRSKLILVVSPPYLSRKGKLVYQYIYCGGNVLGDYIWTSHLSDASVIPYDNSMWNPGNHLIKTRLPNIPAWGLKWLLKNKKSDTLSHDE
jgi:hypothetical protein